MELSYTRNGVTYSVKNSEQLPAKSLAYLLQYGFSQSLQDAIAGDAKRIRDKMIAEADEAGNSPPGEEEIAEAVKAGIHEALTERVAAINDGTVGDRAGVVRDPFGTMCKTVALQMLRDACKASNTKMPDVKTDAGKAKLAEMVEKIIDRNKEAVEKEAKRRLSPLKGVTVDISDLM